MSTLLMTQLSQGTPESSEVVSQFGEALLGFRLNPLADPFDLLRSFKSIAAEQAYKSDTTDAAFTNWELETKLWHLVELLVGVRRHPSDVKVAAFSFSSNAVHQENFLADNKELREIWTIISWLNDNASQDLIDDLDSLKWFRTKMKLTNSTGLQKSNVVSHLDSDAPLRERMRDIDATDHVDDEAAFAHIYALLQRNQIQQAIEAAQTTNNWTLGMILAGVQVYVDPAVDVGFLQDGAQPSGNKHKALWRRAVFQLSRDDKLPESERAIYAFLSGDVAVSSHHEWETHVLLHANCIFQTATEDFLIRSGRVPSKDLSIPLPKPVLMNISLVLNALSESSDPAVRQQCQHPLRVLMGSVMIDQVSTIVGSSLKAFTASNLTVLTKEPYLLRVLTHLCVFLHTIDPAYVDQDNFVTLLTLFASRLCSQGLVEHLPVYVSYLPELEARKIYSFFLTKIAPAARVHQLHQARLLGLPIENIMKATVSRAFEDTAHLYDAACAAQIAIDSPLQDVDSHDAYLCSTVEWFLLANMHADAISAIIALARRLLLAGKVNALRKFTRENSLQKLLKTADLDNFIGITESITTQAELDELAQYDQLMAVFELLNEWDSTAKLLQAKLAWTAAPVVASSKTLCVALHRLILEWMRDLAASLEDAGMLHELRSLYAPHLTFELQRVLVQIGTRSDDATYLDNALELIELVADEKYKLFQLFRNCGRLREFMTKSGEVAVLALKNGERGLYR
ncbi:hypothetical protein BABINDRAFT_160917 [Babjeviella inositovora NRRL Y-12698]|uniref:Nuclear pore complex protein n=1 Tax=Babjeviella inositovora NRRL Y-12698 TaxID=984486 RepID=A0A1E3QSN6_9ASCO|nr:uncharacterized protein BABINDRAFT_160917 [Babjeviella inositovora NRRL Y-12698]ODQ80680.1 hypothetical protein BABINDRAFT_160917 [Babjeviella inositovora NRRL Y-12698]